MSETGTTTEIESAPETSTGEIISEAIPTDTGATTEEVEIIPEEASTTEEVGQDETPIEEDIPLDTPTEASSTETTTTLSGSEG